MSAGTTRQEQEPPDAEVRETAPGVLRLQLPVDMPGLGHVNTYALLDERGAAVVDAGVPGEASWAALLDGLGQAGLSPRDVHTIVVTHSHPDHYGGAHRLTAEGGARLVTHGAWRTRLWPGAGSLQPGAGRAHAGCAAEIPDVDARDVPATNPWEEPLPWGGESLAAGFRARLAEAEPGERYQDWLAPEPDRVVADGDVLVLGGREWSCIHTPGHTLDHLCLHDPESGVVLAGDHVLPTITPHIAGIGGGRDPLASFVASLDRMASLDPVAVVLPAHGQPFHDLAARVGEIKAHHEGRLDRLREISAALGPATVADLSHELFRPDHWGPMAESETYAHVEHLRLAGLAERWEAGGRLLYRLEPVSGR